MRRHPVIGIAAAVVALAACAGEAASTTTTPTVTAAVVPTTTALVTSVPPAPTSQPTTSTVAATTTTTLPPLRGLALRTVIEGLDHPNGAVAPRGDSRLFVYQRHGEITLVRPDGTSDVFADLGDVVYANGIEQGLLGLAFHPDFASNGRLFVYYTDRNDDDRLMELTVGDDPDRVDPASLREVLVIEHPASNNRHNAGMLQFGPDGYLYVSVGDGGESSTHAQDAGTLRAAILRIDVDAGRPYAAPPDNPFVTGGGAPEVWAYGLRNPWRFSIDATDGLMYIGDVGQERFEEVDVVPLVPAGYDFGWAEMEGSHCYTSVCDANDPVLPVLEYSHDEGCSITGGFVYRGTAIPELQGHYFYGDWCNGWIRSFRYVAGAATDEADWSDDLAGLGQPDGFGVDAAGELYVATWDGDLVEIIPIR